MNILMLIMNLLPTILNAIVSVEQAFPGAPGAAKKSVVMGAVQQAAELAHGVTQATDVIVPAVSQTIDGVVAALNTSGLWPKGTAALQNIKAAAQSTQLIIHSVDAAIGSIPSSAD